MDAVIPERLAESIRRLKKGDKRPVGGAASLQQPLIDRVREKTAKTYEIGRAPVDLLLYYDRELSAFELPPQGKFGEWAEMYMLPEIRNAAGQFSVFRVFDRNERQVLWRFEPGAARAETT